MAMCLKYRKPKKNEVEIYSRQKKIQRVESDSFVPTMKTETRILNYVGVETNKNK